MTATSPSGLAGREGVRLPLLVAIGWLAVWAALRVVPVPVEPAGGAVLAVVLAALVVVGWTSWRAHRDGPRAAAGALVVGTAVLLSGAAAAALQGTAWGFAGLWADASFRTEAATRYADQAGLADYAYADTPAYYPPALSWLQGRAAALLDVAAWTVLKPSQVLLAAVVPLLAYWLMRRVLPDLQAAVVVAAASLLTADLLKPDEWLVLMCAVPWWLDLVRGVRAGGVRRWPWWVHGLLGGAILLTHTFYLLPLALATLAGWAVDLARRRRLELRPPRALGVVVIGLAVASPYWFPVVAARLAGAPSDDLQLRYTYPGANVPPWPVPTDAPGALGLIGVLWLAWAARGAWHARGAGPRTAGRHARNTDQQRVAGALVLVLVGAWLTMLAGAIGVHFDIGLLAFKADEVVVLVMAATGAMGLLEAARAVGARARRTGSRDRTGRAGQVLCGVAAAAAVVAVALHHAEHWVVGHPVASARTTLYPDGTRPEGGAGLQPTNGPAWVAPGDPSVAEVRAAWTGLTGRPPGSGTVLVTTRVDLLATTPVHLFTTWKSIYSNPLGEFEARVTLLEEVAACPDSACAADLLTDNPYDRVDGLVLAREGEELVVPIMVDDFPDRSRTTALRFPEELFDGEAFTVSKVGRLVVVSVD